jgi:hypothetical protein
MEDGLEGMEHRLDTELSCLKVRALTVGRPRSLYKCCLAIGTASSVG